MSAITFYTTDKDNAMTLFTGFDIESTGVDPMTDRIVTFSIIAQDGEDENVHEWLINPGVEIAQGASDVHGITTEHAQKYGQSPDTALQSIWNTMKHYASLGATFSAYNCPFDLTMLREELKRHGVIEQGSTEVEDLIRESGIIDPLVVDKALHPYRRGSRKLIDVASHHGFSLTNAHNSTADVEATLYLAKKFSTQFEGKVSKDELMTMQQEAKTEQAQSLSEYFKRSGRKDWEVDGSWPIRHH